jgi:hypothetical protein
MGIQLKADEWENEGRIVIDVDLKGSIETFESFSKLFETQVLNSLEKNRIEIKPRNNEIFRRRTIQRK